ncbi:GNAT family N-acetyltransferase [Bacillus sp. FJAT-27225]|uniref:GNAT family N-acetyltransferase n=1 Tax=Bacillus sp. FJAT-27225 TaxID=1743144 RepID=UPI00080C28F0|nr:GNAT family N-acetyltransferase [Bacillus sp. FJAT-27225]OCA84230.1 GNAT family N-acetyltransferase [Bacillus sp. FJAT-27225]
MDVVLVSSEKEKQDAFSVRKTVFIEEQHVPEEEEIDQYEDACAHFVLYDGANPVGAGRFRVIDDYGKVQRICVLKDARGTGAGSAIMNKIEEYAKTQGVKKLKLDAQVHAIPFYSRLGYEVVSEEFLDAGIPHKTMVKKI